MGSPGFVGVSYSEMMKSNKVEKLSTHVNTLTHYVLVEKRGAHA